MSWKDKKQQKVPVLKWSRQQKKPPQEYQEHKTINKSTDIQSTLCQDIAQMLVN